ncbi:MAG: DUF1036 domain-containing protein [Candidatus Anaerobiospirillum pullicola]|uniref:DUF1036 domain-containing protein n=1 Tax=Candidatus Anaerobiospirillum pullicola TaxID=2838451 RepID=A0A948THG6_9GAMM|nr:DUF1036 domain-containing protein [Candidatus Anaerobiospirillum pullicola]
MLKKIVSVLTVCAAAVSFQVQALTLECKNLANVPIAVAVSYLDYDGKTWLVEGWYNFEPGERANIELDSSNDIFYIFGEFSNGSEVAGGSGSLTLPIYYRTFKYVQGQVSLPPDRSASFVRGVASKGVAQISFGPL